MYKVLHKQILLPNPGTFIPAPDRYVLRKTGLRVVFQPARVSSPIFSFRPSEVGAWKAEGTATRSTGVAIFHGYSSKPFIRLHTPLGSTVHLSQADEWVSSGRGAAGGPW